MCDENGGLIFANRWHEETFGLPVTELMGEGWQSIIHPADQAVRRNRFNPPQNRERKNYHKPIGNAARLVCSNGEAGTFAASGFNDIKGT